MLWLQCEASFVGSCALVLQLLMLFGKGVESVETRDLLEEVVHQEGDRILDCISWPHFMLFLYFLIAGAVYLARLTLLPLIVTGGIPSGNVG